MKSSARWFLLATAVLIAAVAPARAGEDRGGMAGLLGGVSHDDHVEGEGRGTAAAPKTDEPRPDRQPPPDMPDRPSLDDRIAKLEKQIAAMKATPRKDVPPVNSLEEAEKAVEVMTETRDRMREQLDAADREATRQAAREFEAFHARWKERLAEVGKDFTVDDIRGGEVPEGVDLLTWARLCDDYWSEHMKLAAKQAETRQGLAQRRRRQLAELDRAIRRAKAWLAKWRKLDKQLHPDGTARALVQKEMGVRTHLAALAAAERGLRDLQNLRAERRGKKSDREDPLAKEMYRGTGYWMSDALRNQVLREMILADCGYPPKKPPHERASVLGDPPDWMGKFDHLDRQRAKVAWIAEQLRLAHRSLALAEKELRERDAAELRRQREILAEIDREKGMLDDTRHVFRRKLALAKRKRHLERTRKKRVAELRAEYREDADRYAAFLEKESAALRDMEKKAGAASEPEPTGD